MLVLLFIGLLTGALLINVFQKTVLRKKEPNVNDLWIKLENEDWYQQLLDNPKTREWIASNKQNGLLTDPYYVQKIIEKEIHRETFIKYITDKTRG